MIKKPAKETSLPLGKALITNAWLRSSYAAQRNLNNHGVEVFMSDSRKLGMGQVSRHKSGFYTYRSHYADEAGYVQDLIRIMTVCEVDLILPGHNDTEILAKCREQLPSGTDALLPNAEHCALFNDKSRGYDLAQSCGMPVPLRVEYTNIDELAEKLRDQGLERCVIKLRTGNSAKGVFYAHSPNEGAKTVRGLVRNFDLPADRLPQVEEYVSGEGWGCSVLYWHGRRIASFTHRRVREKIATGGTSTLREVATHLGIEQATHQIFDSIGWHGLAMSEWKVCPESGRFWFVEVNPRMWGSIALSISAGVEFPYLAWLCAVEGEQSALDYHKKAMVRNPWVSRWLLGDLTVGAQQIVSGQFREAYHTLIKTEADTLDDFFWDDPMVFLGEVGAYALNAARGLSINPVEKGMIG